VPKGVAWLKTYMESYILGIWRGGFFIETYMTCMGDYEIKLLIYKEVIKNNKCICTNNRLENGLMYLY
jgi:hypothetical protein